MNKRISTALILTACTYLASCASTSPVVHENASAKPAATSTQSCEALAGKQFGTNTIEKAEPVASGDPLLGFMTRVLFKIALPGYPTPKAPVDFCRTTAKLRPVVGSEITADVWLPRNWNGKFLANGGAGLNGGLFAAPFWMAKPMAQGYAIVVTDAGHKVTNSAKFTHEHPEQFIDYAYRANHVAAVFAKDLLATYYGTPVKRAYFHGCSNGGRDALMEARRFPDDYDGIIAGAPATAWSKLMTSFAWNAQALSEAPKLGKKLKLVQDAVLKKCDALDGVQDQLLENPRNCSFDPSELLCKAEDGADCLTASEVSALHKIYGGPQLRDGPPIYSGMPVGGEGLPGNWDSWITNGKKAQQSALAAESFRWMVYGDDADWKLSSFDIDRDYPKAKERMGPIMDSDDPDLSAFTGRGGKLMLYHGWNDGAIPAGATLDYYAALQKKLGPVADEQVRAFMVPGMMHCTGGVGPNSFDVLGEMDKWVEGGKAPDKMTATQFDPPYWLIERPDAKAVRTRPLCAWPKVARYSGSGSSDDAANFDCK